MWVSCHLPPTSTWHVERNKYLSHIGIWPFNFWQRGPQEADRTPRCHPVDQHPMFQTHYWFTAASFLIRLWYSSISWWIVCYKMFKEHLTRIEIFSARPENFFMFALSVCKPLHEGTTLHIIQRVFPWLPNVTACGEIYPNGQYRIGVDVFEGVYFCISTNMLVSVYAVCVYKCVCTRRNQASRRHDNSWEHLMKLTQSTVKSSSSLFR